MVGVQKLGGETLVNTQTRGGQFVAALNNQSKFLAAPTAGSAPVITSDGGGGVAAVSIVENRKEVTKVVATDLDPGSVISYSIAGGADAALFTIDAATGVLSFKATPDFERPTDVGSNGIYDVIVRASDGSLTDDQAIAVTITNVNEAPVITSNGGGPTATVKADENQTAVTTVAATDVDKGTAFTYSIFAGADAAAFTIDARTGVLSFKAAPDYEKPTDAGANNVYDVIVRVSDGTLTDDQAIAVAVTNVVEVPTKSYLGTALGDTFTVTDGNGWRLSGLDGNDTLTGGALEDVLMGGRGDDKLDGGAGDDIFRVALGEGIDSFVGGAGYDRIIANSNGTQIGISFMSGIEEISGNDLSGVALIGTASADVMNYTGIALTGIAAINGGAGNDTITGSAGNDIIVGGTGDDALAGGAGADTFQVSTAGGTTSNGDGADRYDGGAGIDRIVATAANTQIGIATMTGIEQISAGGYVGVGIVGTGFADTLNFSAVTLTGIVRIDGGAGTDTITGSAGADTIIGGAGADKLWGGAGADQFVYKSTADSTTAAAAADVIGDFQTGADRIDVFAIDANTAVTGDQAFTFVGTSAFSKVAGQLRIDSSVAGVTGIMGDVNGDGVADFLIKLTGNINIAQTDLIL